MQIVKILSLSQFKEQYSELKNKPDHYFISILDPCNKEVIDEDSDVFKTWWFYDLDYSVGNNKIIEQHQAKEIAEHIINNEDKMYLYVHCTMGVARSGAIGESVNDLMGIPYRKFKSNNPNIVPNTTVKLMVYKELYNLLENK